MKESKAFEMVDGSTPFGRGGSLGTSHMVARQQGPRPAGRRSRVELPNLWQLGRPWRLPPPLVDTPGLLLLIGSLMSLSSC